jgi:hypothetical protein
LHLPDKKKTGVTIRESDDANLEKTRPEWCNNGFLRGTWTATTMVAAAVRKPSLVRHTVSGGFEFRSEAVNSLRPAGNFQ